MSLLSNLGGGNDTNYGNVGPLGNDNNSVGIGSSDSNYGVGQAENGATGTRADDTNYGNDVVEDDRTIGEKIADVLTGGHPDEGLAPA